MRRQQYQCDIVYGTNSEMGFDYLRDNGMATSKAEQVQRGHAYAIVDEVDSILIDEARTPLIIAGPGDGELAPVRQVQGRDRAAGAGAEPGGQPLGGRGEEAARGGQLSRRRAGCCSRSRTRRRRTSSC